MEVVHVVGRLKTLGRNPDDLDRPPLIEQMRDLCREPATRMLVWSAVQLEKIDRETDADMRKSLELELLRQLDRFQEPSPLERLLTTTELDPDLACHLAEQGVLTIDHARSLSPEKMIRLRNVTPQRLEELRMVVAKYCYPLRRTRRVKPINDRRVQRAYDETTFPQRPK